MEIAGFLPPDKFWAISDQLDQEVRAGAANLPLFTIDHWGGTVMLDTWQLDGTEGGVVHGNAYSPAGPLLEVVTTTQDPYIVARNRWRPSTGIPHNFEEVQRQNATFSALYAEPVMIAVDDADTNFTLWLGTGSWLAAGAAGGFGIVIDAQRMPPPPEAVSLRRVPDVEPLLQARRAALKAIRGEA